MAVKKPTTMAVKCMLGSMPVCIWLSGHRKLDDLSILYPRWRKVEVDQKGRVVLLTWDQPGELGGISGEPRGRSLSTMVPVLSSYIPDRLEG
jgi:hypothetical protein